eukprot:8229993-Pyramimonas_sp.AAC.1
MANSLKIAAFAGSASMTLDLGFWTHYHAILGCVRMLYGHGAMDVGVCANVWAGGYPAVEMGRVGCAGELGGPRWTPG